MDVDCYAMQSEVIYLADSATGTVDSIVMLPVQIPWYLLQQVQQSIARCLRASKRTPLIVYDELAMLHGNLN
jgi:hypothetical protein